MYMYIFILYNAKRNHFYKWPLFHKNNISTKKQTGAVFCAAQFSTAVCSVHLSVRLGLCPTLLAKC